MNVNQVSSISTAAEPSDAASAAAYAKCIGALWQLRIWTPERGSECPPDETARPLMPQRHEVRD